MGFFRRGKEEAPKSQNQPPKSVWYVMRDVGSGPSCEYSTKISELIGISTVNKDGKSTSMTSADACSKVLEVLGLPTSVSYFAQGRKLMVDEQAKDKIEKDPEIQKKLRAALGIDEKQEIKFEKYL